MAVVALPKTSAETASLAQGSEAELSAHPNCPALRPRLQSCAADVRAADVAGEVAMAGRGVSSGLAEIC